MFVSKKELTNLKLKSIKADDLKELVVDIDVELRGSSVADSIKQLIKIPQDKLDSFIKRKYQQQVKKRQELISDIDLIKEINKVNNFNWGVVQGQLDQKIQSEYVRKIFRYNDLIEGVKNKLHNDITSYVIATWYNHWTTILIENHISLHSKVIPTLKNNFGVDIFFGNQPFDLKTTYLPKDYSIEDAIKNPKRLARWMYENQGEQRFGYDNRFFVVLVDKNNLDQSWKLKRDFNFIFDKIDNFFNQSTVSTKDEIVFIFKGKTYTTVAKVLIITK